MAKKTETVDEAIARDAADVMRALQFKQGEQIVATPLSGEYKIGMRANMTFHGDADTVAALLAKAYPGCTFTW